MASIATINVDLVARSGQFSRGVGIARSDLQVFNRDAVRTSVSVERSFSSVGASAVKMAAGITAALAAFKGIRSVANLAIDSVQLATEAEKTTAAFEVMLGSAKETADMIGRIRSFAAQSPYTFGTSADISKQLLAAGIEADQVVPTLRMLGDLAAGDKEKLGRLAYAYGQVRAAGRLYGTELRQVTEAQVPLVPALADLFKKPTADVRELVEEGKAGFEDLKRSIASLTAEGGRFHGMTEKYGRTFGGLVEQLHDAIDITKIELGTAIIEEAGLKDATRDLTLYTSRVREYVQDIRPAIRFTADMTKAVVQLGHEFVRFTGTLGSVGWTAILRAVPEIDGIAAKIHAAAKELQEFRLDPVTGAELALDITGAVIDGISFIGKAMQAVGVDADKWLVQPFRESANELKKMAEEVRGIVATINAAKGAIANPSSLLPAAITYPQRVTGRILLSQLPKPEMDPDAVTVPPSALMPPLALPPRRTLAPAEDLLSPFAVSPSPKPAIDPEWLGAIAPPAKVQVADLFPKPKPVAPVQDAIDPLISAAHLKADLRAMVMPEAIRRREQYRAELAERDRERAARFAAERYTQAAGLVGGTFDAVGLSARNAAKAMDELRFASEISVSILDAAKRAKQEFGPKIDPLTGFKNELTDLTLALGLRKIGGDVYNAAVVSKFRDMVGQFGGLEYRLASAAEYGTADISRAAMQAFTPNPSSDPATLLKVIAEILNGLRGEARDQAKEIVRAIVDEKPQTVELRR